MIYLDNAATTPMYSELAEIYAKFSCDLFFNPSALYAPSLEVNKALRQSKEILAEIIGASYDEIFITGSATEANNLAIMGAYKNNTAIVISDGEHASVYNTAMALKNKGAEVKIIPLNSDGTINEQELLKFVSYNKVSVVSLIHVSNETGAINDIRSIAKKIKSISPRTVVHSDGVQAYCKVDTKDLGVDLYSISAHKIKGPKGIGALYIKKGISLNPIIYGGGQEKGIRSGTENVAATVAFGQAAKKFKKEYDINYISSLKQLFIEKLHSIMPDIVILSGENCSPNIISLVLPQIKGETMLHMLEAKQIYIGLGSACSASAKSSRVILAMGVDNKKAPNAIRISLSMSNTQDEIIKAAEAIGEIASRHKLVRR